MAKIPTILEAGRADGKLATSDTIFDKNKGMFQSEINDIQDTLNSDNPNKPLSAKQGKVLKELLDAKVIETGSVPIDIEPTEGNTTHIVSSDGLAKEFNKCNTAIINTDRIEDDAVTISKLEPSIQSLLKTLYSSYAESDLADGYYILNGVKVSGPALLSGWKCIKISVTSGDKFTLTTRGGATGRAYAFAKDDGTILQVAEENAQLENEEITTPSDSAYLYVNFLIGYVTFSLKTAISESVFQLISEIKNDVAKNSLDITNCNSNIAELKNAIGGIDRAGLNDGYYNLSGTTADLSPIAQSLWKCYSLAVKKDDTFYLSTSGGNTARAFAFTDSERVIKQVAPASTVYANEKIIAPNDGYLFINCSNTEDALSLFSLTPYNIFGKLLILASLLSETNEEVNAQSEKLSTLFASESQIEGTFVQNGIIATDGSFISNSSFIIYRYAVQPGDVVLLHTQINSNDNAGRAQIAAYNGLSFVRVVSTGEIITDIEYTVPNGVDNICMYNNVSYLQYAKKKIGHNITDDVAKNAASISDHESRIRVLEEETMQSKKYTNSDMYTDDEGKKNYYYVLTQGVGGIAPENPVKFTNDESSWGCIKIPVVKGQQLTISTIGGSAGRAYALTDKSRKILVVADAGLNTETTPIELVVQEDGFLYVNCTSNVDTKFYVISKVPFSAISDHVDNLDDRVSFLESEKDITAVPKISNPPIDIRKDVMAQLRVLDIGNSFTDDSTSLLSGFISTSTQDIDTSNICFYRCLRGGGSFKTFYDSWHNQDTYSGTTEPMCHYSVNKLFGGLSQPITGVDALAKMHSCFTDAKWDMIIIHQVSTYSGNYDIWEGNTDGGYLKEFIRIIKLYQPQATIGFLMSHASFSQSPNGDTRALYSNIAKSVQKMYANYGIDFIIPVATAVENLRASEALKTMYPNVTKGYSRDAHHLGYGLARYVANATYFQSLLGKRYGVSVFGNAYRYSVTSDEKESATYPEDCIDVTNSNATLAQLCAINACNEMYNIVSPDNILATIE